MFGLSLLPLLSLPLALLLAPLAAHAQFSPDNTPVCCRTCYASTLTQYDQLKPDAVKGRQQWDSACSYAASTSSVSDDVHSSFAAKVATDPGLAVMPLVTPSVAPSTSATSSATATALPQSDSVRLASTSSSSTSGAVKLVCTSLFALVGAVILAVVVFLEAGPSL
ncbi:hypothetical protein JCM10295v2_005947 [Rhodotorula toruloides]